MGQNLKNIIEGYSNLATKNNEHIERIASIRQVICDECDSNSRSLVPYCKECGCIIKAKIRSEDSKCPLRKW